METFSRPSPSTNSGTHDKNPRTSSTDRKYLQSDMSLMSPPVTPHTSTKKRDLPHDLTEVASPRDPVLFPPQEAAPHADVPLFETHLSAEALVDEHINSHIDKANRPTKAEYFLALSCVPIVSTQYNRNPAAWARGERKILEQQMAKINRFKNSHNLKRIVPAPAKKATQPRAQQAPRARRTHKSTPKQQPLDAFESPAKTRTLGINRDDTDYNALMDFAPPIETLGTKALKADWKGQMLDLSHDVDKDMLSPAEISLASTLRLSCATYLCSKRRIFEARVKALGIGKEFRKTDAQQACKIDVNKASKLWTAYERVGWFKPEHFYQYLK